MIWSVVAVLVVGLFLSVDAGFLFALMPWYVIAVRFQPAALAPVKMDRVRVWLRGVKDAVLDRFPPLDQSEGGRARIDMVA